MQESGADPETWRRRVVLVYRFKDWIDRLNLCNAELICIEFMYRIVSCLQKNEFIPSWNAAFLPFRNVTVTFACNQENFCYSAKLQQHCICNLAVPLNVHKLPKDKFRKNKKVSVIEVILVRIFPYSVQMRENTDQNNSEHGHFSLFYSDQ